MKLSIIIPTYNEEYTIRELIKYVDSVKYPVEHEIIIIDDCSVDRTFEKEMIIRLKDESRHIRLFRNRVNKGKGASIRQGLKHAGGDIVVIQDADFEYDPAEIPKLIEPILRGEAAVVYGSRFLERGRPAGMALPNYVANKILTLMTNVMFGAGVTDMETCYKVIQRELVKRFRLRASRFDFEPEITAKIAKAGVKVKELPISYKGRTAKEGKKIKAWDFFSAVFTLVRCRFFDK